MLVYKIHYTLPDGSEDSVIVSAENVADLREKANHEVNRRSGTNPWSEEVT